VAVKVIKANLAPHSDVATRFRREAMITAQLQHPAIPPVHDYGLLPDGRPFLAMKLIAGETLDKALAANHGPTRKLQVFAAICQAVAYAHSRGVVHRDLKPSNVMVGAFNEVQVMDWGIAKLLTGAGRESLQAENPSTTLAPDPADTDGDAGSMTIVGAAFGTPSYMPPEQALGEHSRVGRHSDSFTLGGLLAYLLTGKPTYTGARAEILEKARAGSVGETFARLDASGAPREVLDLAKRCLAPRIEDRPANGAAVAEAIQTYLDASEKRAREAEAERAAQAARAEEATLRAEAELERAEEATKRVKAERAEALEHRKRRKVQFALAAAVAAILVGGISFAWWSENRAAKQAAAELARKADDDRKAAATRERDSRNAAALQAALERCEAALRAEATPLAEAALADADKRAAEGGGSDQKATLARLKDETRILRALDTIDDLEWKLVNEELTDRKTMIRELAAAFRTYGIVPGSGTPQEQAKRIAASPIRDRLLTGLDRWHAFQRTEALLPLLQIVDPDPYRNDVRNVIQQENGPRLRALANDPVALQQPPHFGTVIGNFYELPPGRRDRILLAAYWRKPNDYVMLMSLANLYAGSSPAIAGQRMKYLTAAIALRPESITAWNNLGNALLDYGDVAHSVAALRVAVRLDPKSQTARFNLGVALKDGGDLDGAIAEYRAEIELNPETAESYVNLAAALEEKGDPKAAVAIYNLAMKVHPKDHKPYLNLAIIEFNRGRDGEALELAKTATEKAPKSSLCYRTLGKIQTNLKDLPAAKRSFETAVRLAPKDPDAHAGIGVVREQMGDIPGAIEKFEYALTLDPKNEVALKGLARVKKGEPGKK